MGRQLIPNVPLRPTGMKLFATNGTPISLVGEVSINFQIAGHSVPSVVLVSEVIDELMLGIDWLSPHKCR